MLLVVKNVHRLSHRRSTICIARISITSGACGSFVCHCHKMAEVDPEEKQIVIESFTYLIK